MLLWNISSAPLSAIFTPHETCTGDGAVAAYVMGAAKAVLEWVTVPVLAIALGLPHGALVYWLSSSTFSVCQARYFGWSSVERP